MKEISQQKSGNVGHHNKDFVLQKPGVISQSLLCYLTQLINELEGNYHEHYELKSDVYNAYDTCKKIPYCIN